MPAKFLSFSKLVCLLLSIILLTGCSTSTIQVDSVFRISPDPSVSDCVMMFQHLQVIIKDTGVQDSQAVSVKGFPYLRTDRFLASFNNLTLNEEAHATWLDQLQRLASQGLSIELANMDADNLPGAEIIDTCIKRLRRNDFEINESRTRLNNVIHVPDEYQTWKRIVGLYWLTAWGTKLGTQNLHKEILETYNSPVNQMNPIKYLPPDTEIVTDKEEVKTILMHAYHNNSLGIPELSMEERNRFFSTFAPILVIDTRTDDDRIGAPVWLSDRETPVIDTKTPVLYRHISYTRFHDKILLQLNYVFWFPARPKVSSWDYLGGNIDGLTWRVTLNEDGEVLAYDAIHNCGCYHLFFPTSLTCTKRPEGVLHEPAFSPKSITNDIDGKSRINLYIAHTSHYIDQVTMGPVNEKQNSDLNLVEYNWADYNTLRSIRKEDGTRKSLFQNNGIIAGTQRGERYFLWPMGIPAPGEMRQWGHHATAFYGRRHFDDLDIIERSFRLKKDEECY